MSGNRTFREIKFPISPSDWMQIYQTAAVKYRERDITIADLKQFLFDPDPGLPGTIIDIEAAGFIVRQSDPPHDILGGLVGTHYNEDGSISHTEEENALWLAAVEMDVTESQIVALRPLPIHASTIDFLAPEIAVTGMNLPENQYGYTLEVMDDGRTVIAVPKPAPPAIEITTGTTDHDLTATPDVWVPITDPMVLANAYGLGDIITVRAFVSENGNEGGTLSLGIGIDGADPLAGGIQFAVSAGSKFTAAGTYENTGTVNIGQSVVLMAKAVGAGQSPVSFNGLWVYKQSSGDPGAGEINHQDGGAEMRVHKADKNDNYREDELLAVPIGATIARTGGTTWTVTSVSNNGSHMRYGVTPTTRDPETETTFTFTWTPPSNADINILGSTEASYLKFEQRA